MGYILLAIMVAAAMMEGWSLLRKKNCKKEIQAVFVKNHPLSGKKKNPQCTPIFRYSYDGKEYEETSFECFSLQMLDFMPGETYTIYVNEKKPKDFVVDTAFNKEDVFIFGGALLCAAVVAFLLFF